MVHDVHNNVGNFAGGAVYNYGGDVIVKNGAVLEDNSANGGNADSGYGGDGGALWNGGLGHVEILDSAFLNNQTLHGFGGALMNFEAGTYMRIENSTFEGNNANSPVARGGSAGAGFNKNGLVEILNSEFINNTAAFGNGGAWLNHSDVSKALSENDGRLFVWNSLFERNAALSIIENSSLYGNGGAIDNDVATVVIDYPNENLDPELPHTSFVNNMASHQGGAIANGDEIDDPSNYGLSVVNAYNTTFEGNVAGLADALTQGGNGGAVFNHDGAQFFMQNGAFLGNVANSPTQYYWEWWGSLLSMGRTAEVGLWGVSALNNEAQNSGGALWNENSTLSVNHSTIDSNQASRFGAGVWASGNVTMDHTEVINNTGATVGGGLYLDSIAALLTNMTVDGNQAEYGGGAYNGGTLNVAQSTLSNNEADYHGGAVYNGPGGTLDVVNSTVSSNLANVNGSGIGTGDGVYNTAVAGFVSATIASNPVGLYGGTVSLDNTILANALNCDSVSVASLGHNLETNNDCGLTGPNDVFNTDPQLDPALANNGGPTLTHLPLSGSPCD